MKKKKKQTPNSKTNNYSKLCKKEETEINSFTHLPKRPFMYVFLQKLRGDNKH